MKKVSPQGSILLSNRWDTGIGEIGILVNAAHQQRFAGTDQFVNQGATWRQTRGPVTGAGTGPATVGTPPHGVQPGYVAYPATITLYQQLNDIKRTTRLALSLQWRPASNFDADVRLLLRRTAFRAGHPGQRHPDDHLPDHGRNSAFPRHQRRAGPAERCATA